MPMRNSELFPLPELWHEPTEVASKPPHYVFPLGLCQHISPSLLPADSEWSFVINFETVAIRFSCNSRETMLEWVECIRHKLGDMGILNPKGNLYSKVFGDGFPCSDRANKPFSVRHLLVCQGLHGYEAGHPRTFVLAGLLLLPFTVHSPYLSCLLNF